MNTGKEAIYGAAGGLPNAVLIGVQIVAVIGLLFTLGSIRSHLRDRASLAWGRAFFASWVWWVFMPVTDALVKLPTAYARAHRTQR